MSKFWHWGLRRQYSLQFGGWIEESPKRDLATSSRGSSRTSTVFTSRWSRACFRPTAGPWLCLRCIAFVASCASSTGTSQDFRKFIVAGMVWVADWRIIELRCLYWAVICCFPVLLVLSTFILNIVVLCVCVTAVLFWSIRWRCLLVWHSDCTLTKSLGTKCPLQFWNWSNLRNLEALQLDDWSTAGCVSSSQETLTLTLSLVTCKWTWHYFSMFVLLMITLMLVWIRWWLAFFV